MNLGEIIKEPIKVKKVFQKEPGIDGFTVELEDGNEVDISRTQWNTVDNKREMEELIIFSTTKGYEISFSLEQASLASNF